jgi:hypothetical protein
MDQRRRFDVMIGRFRRRAVLAAAGVLAGAPAAGHAEPYIAVASGLKCVMCHVNPTGGGKRNLFGMTYARNELAARTILREPGDTGWNSSVTDWLGVGGDWRGGYRDVDTPGPGDVSETGVAKAAVYAEIRAVRNLLTFYVDEQIAPGNTENREAYALVTPLNGKYTVKAGQFFLPFGLRMQDDGAFVRQRSQINFNTPDDGIELGLELPRWSAQAAFSNGTAGSGSVSGKGQTSLSASYVRPAWRVGASLNQIDDPLGDRSMQALFAGWRTGRIAWLAELDFIEDELAGGGSHDIYATLVEGNWRFRKGHNLKVTYEFLDPANDASEDEQERYSVVWEFAPIQLLQARVGYRSYNGIASLPLTNRSEAFVELHAYF